MMPSKKFASITLGILFAGFFSAAPLNAANLIKPPSISSISSDGLTLKIKPAKWSSKSNSTFQWFKNGKILTGSVSVILVLKAKDRGSSLQVREDALFNGKKQSSLSDKFVVGRVTISEISISIDRATGIVKVSSIQAFPKMSKLSYQWFRGPYEISGANSSSYLSAFADEDADLSLTVTAEADGFTKGQATSNSISMPKIERVYKQIWSEEFNGPVLDSKTWQSQNGDGRAFIAGSLLDFNNNGWGNGELQYYLPSQSVVDGDGVLKLKAETVGADSYICYYKSACKWISGKLVTFDRVLFKYGRIEAKIKGPVATPGTWGAFWLLGDRCGLKEPADMTWPRCGELDITELLGRTPKINYGTSHGPISQGAGRGGTVEANETLDRNFHTYAIDWLPDQIIWYFDGAKYATITKTDRDWVYDHEFYILVNLAIGGYFGGEADPSLKSAQMDIDWIRVSTINGVGQVIKK
jgi:beta-glucanase (GH16 family)